MMKILKSVLVGLLVLVSAVVSYLVVVVFFPILRVPKQPIKHILKDQEGPPVSREDVLFSVGANKISAWLYLPDDVSTPVPCVILSHGFGGTKSCVLERYALRFNQAGLAALTYDYRHFGESDGSPRQLFHGLRQLDDLRAAIAYARGREEINPEKIALWGTSAAGGYGLVLAAEDEKIAAVIAQCAGIDHEADGELLMEREGIGFFARLFVHAQRDKGRSRFGLSSHTIPIVGKPGTLAMFTMAGAFEGYERLVSESDTFVNEVCARFILLGHGRNPAEAAQDVRCPVLFLVCENDILVSPDSHLKAVQALGTKATVKSYPIGHFDIYEGKHFETAVKEKIAFLQMIF